MPHLGQFSFYVSEQFNSKWRWRCTNWPWDGAHAPTTANQVRWPVLLKIRNWLPHIIGPAFWGTDLNRKPSIDGYMKGLVPNHRSERWKHRNDSAETFLQSAEKTKRQKISSIIFVLFPPQKKIVAVSDILLTKNKPGPNLNRLLTG